MGINGTDKLENEKELLRRALSDGEFFAVIYEHYYPRLYNYIFLRVANSDTADDLVSQVFQKALAGLESYSSEKGDFSVWLFAIAANTLREHYRTQKRCMSNPSAEIEKLVAGLEPNVEEKIFLNETRGQLLDALKQLGGREQNIIALKFWGDLSNRQIAQMMELNENNVAVILFLTLKRLRQILADHQVEIDK